MTGACLRTRIYDKIAVAFLQDHPDGTIVEIGCGLNTRFERIDNGRATWFDLDLPDSIALRRRFFEDAPRRTMIAASVLDEAWLEQVRATGGPTLLLSEAVMIYLEERLVRDAVVHMAEKLPGAALVTDMCAPAMMTKKAGDKAKKKLGIKTWFKWACDDPKSLERWHDGIELISAKTMPEASPEMHGQLPLSWRALMFFTPWLVRRMTGGYRIAHYRLGAAPSPAS
ncbi:MAG: class I SAM-dependent methyltransferase [Myxococcota bacterium]